MDLRSKEARAAGLVIAVLTTWAVLCATGTVGTQLAQTVSDWSVWTTPIVTGVVCMFVVSRHRGRVRAGWLLLGASSLSWGFGDGAWTYFEKVLHKEPFPSVADIGYLAAVPLAAAAMACFASARKRSFSGLRTVLDGALIAGSLFAVSWAIVLRPIISSSSDGFLAEVISLAYPIGDVLIISVVVFLLGRIHDERRDSLLVIGVALVALAIADSGYLVLVQKNAYVSGSPIDMGWLGGYLLIGVAALFSKREVSVPETPREASVRFPYILAGFALLTTVATAILEGKLTTVELWCLVGLLIIVVARQFITTLEQKSLTIERLESVDEMKTGILYAVSHELRTPLTFIMGASDLLADKGLPDSVRDDLIGKLGISSRKLEALLSGLLDLGRLTRGAMEPVRAQTDVTDLIERIAGSVHADGHTIMLGQGHVSADIDAAQVERIVENLFLNAVRHTPPGTEICADVARVDDGVVISVRDNGPGVPETMHERIFEPFVQVDNLTDLGTGTGIGLALVSKFAELHGGRAWVEDVPNGGADFRVLLRDAALAVA